MGPSKKDIPAIVRALTGPVNQYLAARVVAQDLRRRVDALRDKAIREQVYTSQYDRDRVTDYRQDWHLIPADWDRYYARLRGMMEAEGLRGSRPEFCPALEAESAVLLAERQIVQVALQWFPGMDWDGLICAGIKTKDQYIDLQVRLVVNHPLYRKPANIMEAVSA